ncbi:unnamed protein product [Anisakis simplex]|uniref:MAM domain-containing protein n=1 Tax=Anisakis simplex TaxID=6269 RepID=A0A0M3JQU8_ANISI|nr:unnamed protein product [Anisakis simplex]
MNKCDKIEDSSAEHYIRNASQLNCELNEESCAWQNAETDHLLDTSDFYRFIKADDEMFPLQVRVGDPHPRIGSLFLLAGNSTSTPQSAVLVSAPLACQKSYGELSFKYWLYGNALIEVVVLKPMNPQRRRLQVLRRVPMQCHALRPTNETCLVKIPDMSEPFRLGIRAFHLQDKSTGSFVMISNIHYVANGICHETTLSNIFGGRALPWNTVQHAIAQRASDFNCIDFTRACRWSTSIGTNSEWKVSNNLKKWSEFMHTKTHYPNGTYFYQYVDGMNKKPYALLQSEMIPCTRTVSSLSFRYWLRPGTQVQICSMTDLNVVISCAYLSDLDSPGPINVDVDAPSDEPFRFVFEMIEFDRSKSGLVVIDDLQYTGKLCSEPVEPKTTTINPLFIADLFALQPGPQGVQEYSTSLDCDFEVDFCTQWESDGKWEYGVTPNQEFFEWPSIIEGNVVVAVLNASIGLNTAILQSRLVPCNLTIDAISEESPFNIRIIADSSGRAASIAIIRRIDTSGEVCELPSLNKLACEALQCDFKEDRCAAYTNDAHIDAANGPRFELVEQLNDGRLPSSANASLKATIDGRNGVMAILHSPRFQLTRPIEMEIMLHQPTFGSQTFVCADDEAVSGGAQSSQTRQSNNDRVTTSSHQITTANFEHCQLIQGPKIDIPRVTPIRFLIDTNVERFSLIAFHDKAAQFGTATFTITSIRVLDADFGQSIC